MLIKCIIDAIHQANQCLTAPCSAQVDILVNNAGLALGVALVTEITREVTLCTMVALAAAHPSLCRWKGCPTPIFRGLIRSLAAQR